jgi:hypothetical protein
MGEQDMLLRTIQDLEAIEHVPLPDQQPEHGIWLTQESVILSELCRRKITQALTLVGDHSRTGVTVPIEKHSSLPPEWNGLVPYECWALS